MNPLFIYLLKASATVFILWAFYSLCLRRMTFHRLNRYFFLTGILVSVLWPALPLTEWFSKAPQVSQVVVYIPVTAFVMQFKPETPTFGFEMALKIAYFAGVLFMLARLTLQIFSLRAIFKKSEIRVINSVTVRVVNEKINPFSFFGYIFLNPENHTPTELSAIILHEKVHETRTHSVDIILSELFKILLWFNPFSWLFCRAVKENIEFEVDRALVHQGIDCKEYQYSLLKLSAIRNQIVITNHFNLSNLKTRIIMMNKNQSSRYGLAAYALVIPLILLCMVFSYAFAQEKPKTDTVTKVTTIQHVENKSLPDNALILLDGKVIDKEKMNAISPDEIYSVNVLKGKEATDIYGRKGKNGVVLVTSRNKDTEKRTTITYRIKDSTGMGKDHKPIYIINGKEISENAIKDLDPNQIESIDVLKNELPIGEFGDKGKNGVVKIIMKKNGSGGYSQGSSVSYSTNSSSSSDGKGTTFITTNRSSGEGKGEGKGNSTVTVYYSTDGKGIAIEKRYVVTEDGAPSSQEKHIVINSKSGNENSLPDLNGVSDINLLAMDSYILIDGKEAKLEDLKSADIKDITILKGESATKLYGDKASKGVIMITTKKK